MQQLTRLLRQLLAAKSGTRSDQLSTDQLRLFAQDLKAGLPALKLEIDSQDDDLAPLPDDSGNRDEEQSRRLRRRPSPGQRIEHDLTEKEKLCASCSQERPSTKRYASSANTFLRSC